LSANASEPEPTAFGIAQAVTRAAQSMSPEVRLELELAAGIYIAQAWTPPGPQGPIVRRQQAMADKGNSARPVFALTERADRTYWTKVGIACANRDGSITCKLDALPVSGTLQIRDEDSRRERDRSDRGERKRPNSARPRRTVAPPRPRKRTPSRGTKGAPLFCQRPRA
jgi:hypothetical protein